MKILAVSDVETPLVYSPNIKERFKNVELVIGCGDLPHYYLEYIVSSLDRPMYYVLGNHASEVEFGEETERTHPWGGVNIHQRVRRDRTSGLLMAGIEGSLNYNNGPHQYTQDEMWRQAFNLMPGLLLNRLRFGRYLDILVTHAPPWKIHDADDLPHQGIQAFRWLIRVFKPTYHLHGHLHVLRQYQVSETLVDRTRVINACGFRVIDWQKPGSKAGGKET